MKCLIFIYCLIDQVSSEHLFFFPESLNLEKQSFFLCHQGDELLEEGTDFKCCHSFFSLRIKYCCHTKRLLMGHCLGHFLYFTWAPVDRQHSAFFFLKCLFFHSTTRALDDLWTHTHMPTAAAVTGTLTVGYTVVSYSLPGHAMHNLTADWWGLLLNWDCYKYIYF